MSEQQTNINKRFNINENIKVIYIVSVITALLFIFGFCIFETFRTFTYLDAEETNPFGIILILIVFGVLTYCFYYEWLGQFILIIAFIFFILFIAFNFSEISLSQYKKIDRIDKSTIKGFIGDKDYVNIWDYKNILENEVKISNEKDISSQKHALEDVRNKVLNN